MLSSGKQIRDQKNRVKHEKRTQGRTNDPILNPVIQIANAILRIKRNVLDWDQGTELCTIGKRSNQMRITAELVRETIWLVCKACGGQQEFGFEAEEIANRSLRSGEAMTLTLSKRRYTETHIMFLGRWKSNAFWAYIRPQVMELTSSMATDMTDHTATDLSTNPNVNEVEDLRLDL